MDVDEFAKSIQSLTVEYFSLKGRLNAAHDRLDSYIVSIAAELEIKLSGDIRADLGAIDAEIRRLKDIDKRYDDRTREP